MMAFKGVKEGPPTRRPFARTALTERHLSFNPDPFSVLELKKLSPIADKKNRVREKLRSNKPAIKTFLGPGKKVRQKRKEKQRHG